MKAQNGRSPRILIAGMGNVLRQDDGFGVRLARRLEDVDLPGNASVREFGIGGISLVQDLIGPPRYDVLIILDAAERNGEPGQIFLLEAEVPVLEEMPEAVRRDFLADMHYTTPERALILAKALGVLPEKTWIVGCQPERWDDFEIGLSAPVAESVEKALDQVVSLVDRLSMDLEDQSA